MSRKRSFASALFAARTERRMTQEQVSEMFNISTRWYQKVEKGESKPNFDLTCKIAKKFELNIADFAEEIIA